MLQELQGSTFENEERGMKQVVGTKQIRRETSEAILAVSSNSNADISTRSSAQVNENIVYEEETVTAPSRAVSLTTAILRMYLSSQDAPISISDEVRTFVNGLPSVENNLESLANRVVDRWEAGAWELVESKMQDNNLPLYDLEDESWGLYLDFLRVKRLWGLPEHLKVYGGMTVAKHGFKDRILRCHMVQWYRNTHPSLHYTMYDLPDTDSQFYVWARYPRNVRVEEVVIGEAVMIGLLGLYETPGLYTRLAGIGVPSCMSGMHRPIIGLNRDAGGHVLGSAVSAAEARDGQTRNKLLHLITTGHPVSIEARTVQRGKQIQFMFLRQHKITISKVLQDRYPHICQSQTGTTFIDLHFESNHPNPFYGFEQNPKLQKFRVWLQLSNGTGFWLEQNLGNISSRTSARNKEILIERTRDISKFICESYGLLAMERVTR